MHIRARTPRRPWLRGTPVPLLLAVVLVLVLPGAVAHGHGGLESSSPASGSSLRSAPEEIVLVFSESISPQETDIALVDGHETEWGMDIEVVDDAVIRAALQEGLPGGRYELRWSVPFVDGAAATGVIRFSLGQQDEPVGLFSTVLTARQVAWIEVGAYVLVGGLALAVGAGVIIVYGRSSGRDG